ncbi:BEAN1 protein, partial [Polypterus senegalus]
MDYTTSRSRGCNHLGGFGEHRKGAWKLNPIGAHGHRQGAPIFLRSPGHQHFRHTWKCWGDKDQGHPECSWVHSQHFRHTRECQQELIGRHLENVQVDIKGAASLHSMAGVGRKKDKVQEERSGDGPRENGIIESPEVSFIKQVSSNHTNPVNEYTDFREGGNEASLLVSPLVVAGIVIGLVLFLSCVTIIVGSLRKDGRLRNPHLRTEASYAPDGFSYGGSIRDLRSSCIDEFPPAFDFDSYMETLSQVNVIYPDSPPHYEECVGPGATQIYIPTDDPPPYSVTDPCQEDLMAEASWVVGSTSRNPIRMRENGQQAISSISFSAHPLENAPPYEAVVCEQNLPIPLIPLDLLKHTDTDCHQPQPIFHRLL